MVPRNSNVPGNYYGYCMWAGATDLWLELQYCSGVFLFMFLGRRCGRSNNGISTVGVRPKIRLPGNTKFDPTTFSK